MLLSMVMFSFVSLLYRRPSMVPSISSSAVSMLTTSLAFLPTSRSFLQSYSRIHTNAKLLALKAVSREAEVAEEAMIVGMVSEEFKQLVKGYKSNKAPKKLYAEVLKMAENHAMDRNMTVFAIRNLQRMDRYDLALELVPVWENLASNTSLNTGDLLMALPLLKFCCKEGRMDLAVSIASKFQVYPAYSEEAMTSSPLKDAKSFILPELAHGFVSARAFSKCITVLHHMQASSVSIPAETGKHILKSFLKGESSNQIRAALRYISTMGVDNLSTEVDYIQILCSNYLRTLEFMKGAVSIETLPPEKCPEVCFIGRSNVGKSSLINMLTNMKKLAFTSKTPGKTSEFNYFNAEGIEGADKVPHHFYLVDVPGVGYAEVNRVLRNTWLDLLQDYTSTRSTLRLVFHLVDSRHGLMKADEQCLSLINSLPDNVQYVIVLTKSDKRGGEGRKYIVQEVKDKLKEVTNIDVPVILTSSDTREGGTKLWSVMLDAFSAGK